MKSPIYLVSLICSGLILAACSPKSENSSETVQKEFTVEGVVVEVMDEGRTLVIKHEEMPGYMGAMTMPFRVKEPAEAQGISRGDEIQFTYKVAELSSWIETIKPTGKKVDLPEGPKNSDQSSNLLKAGDQFPDFKLTNEYGEAVQLADYRGSAVALTFIFTRCPVPEYCPAMMRNFQEVGALLKADPLAPKNYRLLTVSFDSEYDTPEVMKAYGEKFKQDSTNWNLLSSKQATSIQSLGDAVGLKFGKSNNAIYSHNLRTVVLDGFGKITKIFTDESWKPEALAAEIKRAAEACCSEAEEEMACCAGKE